MAALACASVCECRRAVALGAAAAYRITPSSSRRSLAWRAASTSPESPRRRSCRTQGPSPSLAACQLAPVLISTTRRPRRRSAAASVGTSRRAVVAVLRATIHRLSHDAHTRSYQKRCGLTDPEQSRPRQFPPTFHGVSGSRSLTTTWVSGIDCRPSASAVALQCRVRSCVRGWAVDRPGRLAAPGFGHLRRRRRPDGTPGGARPARAARRGQAAKNQTAIDAAAFARILEDLRRGYAARITNCGWRFPAPRERALAAMVGMLVEFSPREIKMTNRVVKDMDRVVDRIHDRDGAGAVRRCAGTARLAK